MPMREGIVLGLIFAGLGLRFEGFAPKPNRRFRPYSVSVHPAWELILTDFKLIPTLEDWVPIYKSFESFPRTEFCALRDSIDYTVLEQSEDADHTVVYWDRFRFFSSDFNFDVPIEPVQVERPKDFNDYGGIFSRFVTVRLFFRAVGGYEIGLTVPTWWWKSVRESCPAPVSSDDNPITGQTTIVLARISYREFDPYWLPLNWTTASEKASAQMDQTKKTERSKLGWTWKDEEAPPELSITLSDHIKHSYFDVWHRAI